MGFCGEGKCKVDKSTSQDMSQAVSVDGKKVTFQINAADDLELGRNFGIVVKEPHKFRSCEISQPVVTTPDKVAVRDPHKLTDGDKKAIDKAIRDANTVNGVSKLPNGTGFISDPAFIEFDKDGNVTIISPNDVENDWDNDGNPVYVKNPDGSYKLNEGAKSRTILAKDLIKNLKPESPAIAVNTDDGKVTITPHAYEKPGDDTDLASYTVTYKDPSGAEKTVTATRDLDKNIWSGPGVDENTGMITLSVKDIEVGGTIKATAKDNGGLEGDTDELYSDPSSKKLETATISYDPNSGTGDMESKVLNKGLGYTVLPNAFTAPDDTQEFKAWEVDGKEVAPGTEITIKDNTVIKAVWKKIQTKVSYDANGGSGDMKGAVVDKGSNYTVLPNGFTAPDDTQEFKAWEVDGKEVAPGTEIKVDENIVVKALWKEKTPDTPAVDNYTVSFKTETGAEGTMPDKTVAKGKYTLPNPTFKANEGKKFAGWKVGDGTDLKTAGSEINITGNVTLTAVWKGEVTETVKVSYDANGGSGTMEGKELTKGSTYKLLANGFTAPENKEFDTWEVNGEKLSPNSEITVDKDTVITAIWKNKTPETPPVENYIVSFKTETGAEGTMPDKTVAKGKYTLPKPTFIAEKGKEFAGWKVGDGTELKAVGIEIDITGNVTLTAVWKVDESETPSVTEKVKVSYEPGEGSGRMDVVELSKYSKHTLLANGFTAPENKKFKAWKIGETEYPENAEITVGENTTVTAIWEDIETTTPSKKEVQISFDGNSAKGNMPSQTLEKGKTYKLPENGFETPEGKEFDGWMIGNEKKKPGDEITVEGNVTVVAQWKDKKPGTTPSEDTVKVNYNANGGSGEMKGAIQKKGSKYILSANIFKAPANKEFKAWEVNGKEVAAGTEITLDKDIEIKAIWKDKKATPTPNPGVSRSSQKPNIIKSNNPNNKGKANNTKSLGQIGKNVQTGIESVEGVAGILMTAVGGLFVSKKRKK